MREAERPDSYWVKKRRQEGRPGTMVVKTRLLRSARTVHWGVGWRVVGCGGKSLWLPGTLQVQTYIYNKRLD